MGTRSKSNERHTVVTIGKSATSKQVRRIQDSAVQLGQYTQAGRNASR